MPLVGTDSQEESNMEMYSEHIPDQDVEYIPVEDSDGDSPDSDDEVLFTNVKYQEIQQAYYLL